MNGTEQDVPQPPQEYPSKEGWIRKKSNNFFCKWPTRYFVLDNKCLYCYVTNSRQQFLGGVNFDKISIHILTNDQSKEIVLKPLSAKGSVKLRFLTVVEYNVWHELLKIHIIQSRGRKKALVDYPLWTLNRISIVEFAANASSGDLILFKSKNIATSVQRLLSSSDFDHIGVIYKYPAGDISFLESTKEYGVSICYWDDFLAYGWGINYEKISYRKLEAAQMTEIAGKLQEFIQNVLGKRFSFSPLKLLSRFNNKIAAESDGFFCSELVAKAYQEMGLITNSVPASRFWPGDFSENSKLGLIEANLQQEKVIDFSIIQSVLNN